MMTLLPLKLALHVCEPKPIVNLPPRARCRLRMRPGAPVKAFVREGRSVSWHFITINEDGTWSLTCAQQRNARAA